MEQKAYRMVPSDTQLLQSQQWTEARRQGVQGHSRLHSKNLSHKSKTKEEEEEGKGAPGWIDHSRDKLLITSMKTMQMTLNEKIHH